MLIIGAMKQIMFSPFLSVSLNSTSIFCFMNITELGTLTLFCMECITPGWMGHPGCVCSQAYSLTSPGRPTRFLMFKKSLSVTIEWMDETMVMNSLGW